MTDPQTDWLACGARRTRAQRVAEVVAAREEEHRQQLNLRRCSSPLSHCPHYRCRLSPFLCGLREMLEEEEARHRRELHQRFVQIYEHQRVARMEAAEREKNTQEEERRRQVRLADEQRRREHCHVYREEYSRQLQQYLNETRPLEIQLRNHLRERYGPPPPPGHRL
ncbi:uncharacterized protein LOC126982195 [Eriocheir sinensis]|uniref:uncharacterized protein LOC126982195 n=1 Tax=Eriocheir sinensis TaxID=95602 RepID=UPI0021CA60E7|nr:uncharacterized protein LOC126982195 [Eriocheir sinensis]